MIHREITAQGYEGGVSILRDYIRPKRALRSSRRTVRFETEPGDQMQHDWGCLWTEIGGARQKVHFAVNTLGYSRRFHFWAGACEDAEHTYESLNRSFEYFGGVPAEVLYDYVARHIIVDQLGQHAAEVGEGIDVGGDPVRQAVTRDGSDVGIGGGAQAGDEDLRVGDLAGQGIDYLHRLAGEVDEQPLPGDVLLAHGWREPPGPAPVEAAELAVAAALRRRGPVLLSQQAQRHALAAKLAMDRGPVRLGTLTRGPPRRGRKQQRLQLLIVDARGVLAYGNLSLTASAVPALAGPWRMAPYL